MEHKNNSNQSVLCNNCNQFFGNHDTNYLCSKCYKESQQSEQQSQVAENKLNHNSLVASTEPFSQPNISSINAQQYEEAKNVVQTSIETQQTSEKEQEPSQQVQVNKKLCWECNKKVGLLGFQCKCQFVFCGKHRYAEEHKCSFDFRQQQQDRLAKENPLVKHSKVSKI